MVYEPEAITKTLDKWNENLNEVLECFDRKSDAGISVNGGSGEVKADGNQVVVTITEGGCYGLHPLTLHKSVKSF